MANIERNTINLCYCCNNIMVILQDLLNIKFEKKLRSDFIDYQVNEVRVDLF